MAGPNETEQSSETEQSKAAQAPPERAQIVVPAGGLVFVTPDGEPLLSLKKEQEATLFQLLANGEERIGLLADAALSMVYLHAGGNTPSIRLRVRTHPDADIVLDGGKGFPRAVVNIEPQGAAMSVCQGSSPLGAQMVAMAARASVSAVNHQNQCVANLSAIPSGGSVSTTTTDGMNTPCAGFCRICRTVFYNSRKVNSLISQHIGSPMTRKQARTGPVRYALYARCSTDEQAEGEFTTLDAQEAITRRYVQAQGGTVVKAYSDGGKTGTSLQRPGWKALLADAQAGLFDAVCVTYMSRLGRGDAATIAEYLLHEVGTLVACVHEQYTDDEAGYVSKSVNRLVDGMYVVQVRKHTTAKMREMFDRGFVCGHVPFGYAKEYAPDAGGLSTGKTGSNGRAKEPPQRAVPCPDHADTVRQAFALFGQWRKEDAHPALVDRKTWEAAQDTRRQRPAFLPAQQEEFTYYLRGRVFCPFCGCPYTYAGATGRAGKVFYYVCQSVNRHGKASPCPVRRMAAPRLHLSVLHRLHYVTTHQTALHGMIARSGGWGTADEGLKAQRGQMGKQRQLWEMKRTNYGNAIGEGRALATLLPALEKAEAEIAKLTAQIQSADAQIAAQAVYRPTAARLAEGWGRLFDVWGVLTEEERAELLGAIVERVEMGDKEKAAVDFLPFQETNRTTALSMVQVENQGGSGGYNTYHIQPLFL